DPLLAPSGDDVITLFQLFQKIRDLVWIVLQIAVHRQDELTRRVVEACCQRRSLPEIAAQLHYQYAAVHRGNFFQKLVGSVVGAIVNENQFKTVANLLHHLLQAGIQNGYVVLFVVKRNHNRVLRHNNSIDARKLLRTLISSLEWGEYRCVTASWP